MILNPSVLNPHFQKRKIDKSHSHLHLWLLIQIPLSLTTRGKSQCHSHFWFVIFNPNDPNPTFPVRDRQFSVIFSCLDSDSQSSHFQFPCQNRQISAPGSFIILNPTDKSYFSCKNRHITVLILPFQAPPNDACVTRFLKYCQPRKFFKALITEFKNTS